MINLTAQKKVTNPENEKLLESIAIRLKTKKDFIKNQTNSRAEQVSSAPSKVEDLYYSTMQHMRKLSLNVLHQKQELLPNERSGSLSQRSPSNMVKQEQHH